jgi:hypothetical protein
MWRQLLNRVGLLVLVESAQDRIQASVVDGLGKKDKIKTAELHSKN